MRSNDGEDAREVAEKKSGLCEKRESGTLDSSTVE